MTHDWYCFECHDFREELLIDCKSCFRSFHNNNNCLKGSLISAEFECIYCSKLRTIDNSLRINTISKSRLNELLLILIKTLEFSVHNQKDLFEDYSIESNQTLMTLIFIHIDVKNIKDNTKNQFYDSLQQFENDFQHFIHNLMVLRTKDLNLLKEAFDKELKELKLCLNCYKYSRIDSYEEPNDWFTFVCEPPHQLVYAKQDRWPYWPSKVMAIQNNGHKYIVQYFEPKKFTRSIVTKERIKPIDYYFEANPIKCQSMFDSLILLLKHLKKLEENGSGYQTLINRLNNYLAKNQIKFKSKVNIAFELIVVLFLNLIQFSIFKIFFQSKFLKMENHLTNDRINGNLVIDLKPKSSKTSNANNVNLKNEPKNSLKSKSDKKKSIKRSAENADQKLKIAKTVKFGECSQHFSESKPTSTENITDNSDETHESIVKNVLTTTIIKVVKGLH